MEGSQQGWPDEATGWKYYDVGKWQTDPLLTVTGHININIQFSVLILTISTVERPPPGYPDSLTIRDKTKKKVEFEGNYRRQGNSLVWKYGDYKISRKGKY